MRILALALLLFGLPETRADLVGNGLQNFNPTPDGLDFVTVHSSETLKPGIFNLGLYLNYAVNALPYVGDSPQGRLDFNDTLLGLDLNVGVGLLPNWEIGLSIPFIVAQTVSNTGQLHGEFVNKGNTGIRPMTKYRLLGNDNGGLAFVGSIDFHRTEGNPNTGVDPGPTYNLMLAWDTMLRSIALGLNGGVRLANSGPQVPGAPVAPMGNQIVAGAAASYLLPQTDTKIIAELIGAVPTSRRSSDLDRGSSAFELIGGIKHDYSQNLAIHAGAGTELSNGLASPDWRIYGGINYAFGPVFNKSYHFVGPKMPEDRLILRNIQFEFDSDQMSASSEEAIKQLYEAIRAHGAYKKLRVVGYTDSIGSESYNLALSLKRANAIREHLIRVYKLDAANIEADGRGSANPIADNGNFQGRQENRRVEIEFL